MCLELVLEVVVCVSCRDYRVRAVERYLADSRNKLINIIYLVGIIGRLPVGKRVTAVYKSVAVRLEACTEQSEQLSGAHALTAHCCGTAAAARDALVALRCVIVALADRAAACEQADNCARTVKNILAAYGYCPCVVAARNGITVLNSAGDARCIVLCGNCAEVVAIGYGDRDIGSVTARREVTDDTADRAVACGDIAYVIATADDALAAVTDSTDDTAAPAAARDIRAVPAVDDVRAVAPSDNSADERKRLRAYLAAADADICDSRIRTGIAEQSAGGRGKIVDNIALTVKVTVKLTRYGAGNRSPVVIAAHVDMRG